MNIRFSILWLVILLGAVFVARESMGVSPDPVVSTIAGEKMKFGSVDGVGIMVRFSTEAYVTTDGTYLYVADTHNHIVRKIEISSGQVSTIAGIAKISGCADGIGETARFNGLTGITTDGIYLYVADTNNHTIRKIEITTGTVTTLAGVAGVLGSVDGVGSQAHFGSPSGITLNGSDLYITDAWNNTIRKINVNSGEVSTIAGIAGEAGSLDGYGAMARFRYPIAITTDGINLFIADMGNHTIRMMTISTGLVETLAGSAGITGSNDGVGDAALFNYPKGIATDGAYVYVSDTFNKLIRKIAVFSKQVLTVAGGTQDGIESVARFSLPLSIANIRSDLYVTDMGTLKKIN